MTRRTRRCGSSILQAELEAGRVGAIMCAGRAGTGGAPSGGGRSNPPNGRAAARRPHRERPAPAAAAGWPALAPDVAAALERGPPGGPAPPLAPGPTMKRARRAAGWR